MRHSPDMSHHARLARFERVSTALTPLGDERIGRLLAKARPLGVGIGGTSSVLDVDGLPVFVKRIPLTDLERSPEHVTSTANLFGLPAFCQYGVGSPGFGAWREVAANTMTTHWVLAARSEAFPLMYHWRLAPGAPPLADEYTDVERVVTFWGGSPAVRHRLEALAGASTSVVLFLEYIPRNLLDWLRAQLASGEAAVVSACRMVEEHLGAGTAFLAANRLLHFDAHFRNILTDGARLYFADLGLATSPRFDLSADEAEFVARNSSHDACHTITQLVNWLVTAVCGVPVPASGGPAERNAYIRRCAAGAEPSGVPATVASTVSRYAPVAAVMNDFYWDLFGGSPATPFPLERIKAVTGTSET